MSENKFFMRHLLRGLRVFVVKKPIAFLLALHLAHSSAYAATSLVALPPTGPVGVGDVFDLRLEVQTTSSVDGAAAYVDFDPAVLEVVGITLGTGLPTVLQNRFDNSAGSIDLAAGAFSSFPVTNFTLATLQLRAKAVSAATTLSFQAVSPRQSDVVFGGSSLAPQLTPVSFVIQATGTPATLSLLPVAANVRINSTFDFAIQVQTGSHQADGAAAYLDFDPAILQVAEILPGSALPFAIQSRFDNGVGRLDFAAGSFGPYPSGTFVLATVRLRAVGATASTALVFDSVVPRQSDVTFAGRSLGVSSSGAVVAARAAQASVGLELQPAAQTVAGGEAFEVAVRVVAGTQEVDGAAAYLNFDPVVLQVESIVPGARFPTTLLSNIDNTSGHADFAAGDLGALASGTFTLATVRLRAVAASPSSAIVFSATAERRSDATYGGASVLAQTTPAAVTVTPASATAGLGLMANPAVVHAGETFDLVVRATAGTQRIDGAAAYLDFDPSFLQVLAVTAGGSLGTAIQSAFDNRAGRVDFAAGELNNFPAGTFDVATLRLRALRATASTLISFANVLPRVSDLTFAGLSVLDSAQNLNLAVGSSGIVLAVVPAAAGVQVGQMLDVTLQVRAGARPVDGAAAFLDFDPYVFEPLSITPGVDLPVVLTSQIDAAGGRVEFAAGTFGALPSGTFTLGTVRLRARGASGRSVLGLDDTVPRHSDVTSGGLSVLGGTEGATVNVRGGSVNLAIEPAAVNTNAGAQFDVDVQVQAGADLVDGAAAYVDFDPARLQVVNVTPGAELIDGLGIRADNALGELDFAAGSLGAFASGTVTLATVKFRAVAQGATELVFAGRQPRNSDATFGGVSVLGGTTGAQVVIGAALPSPCTCAGDADRSGFVNFSDYASVRGRFGRPADLATLIGDADCNGFVNFGDYAAVRAHFGESCPP